MKTGPDLASAKLTKTVRNGDMLLNSLLMNLQGQVTGVNQAAETPDSELLNGEQGTSESAFSKLFDEFGLTVEEGLDEQELTALLADFVEQTGEMLPQSTAPSVSTVAFDTETSEGLDRDQLLSFLMANANQELPPDIKEALAKLPAMHEASVECPDMSLVSEEAVEFSGSAMDELTSVEPVKVVEDETATDPDLSDLTNDGIPPLANSADGLPGSNKSPLLNEVVDETGNKTGDETVATEPLVSDASRANGEFRLTPEADRADALVDADDSVEFSNVEKSPLDSPVADVATTTDAAAASAVAATVVVGEIKNQTMESNRLSPSGTASLVSAGSEEPPVNAKLQSAIQNQLSSSESVAGKTDPLVRDTLDGKSDVDDAALEVDIERPSNAQTSLTANRSAEKSASPTLNSQLLADQLNRPVRLTNAHQALTERITTMVTNEIKHAVIQLDPAELGHLEIRLHIQNEQTQVQIVASTAQSRDALEQQAARLRESLSTQGLNLAQLDVSDQSEQPFQGESGESRGERTHQDDELAESLETEHTVQQTVGLVNHFV